MPFLLVFLRLLKPPSISSVTFAISCWKSAHKRSILPLVKHRCFSPTHESPCRSDRSKSRLRVPTTAVQFWHPSLVVAEWYPPRSEAPSSLFDGAWLKPLKRTPISWAVRKVSKAMWVEDCGELNHHILERPIVLVWQTTRFKFGNASTEWTSLSGKSW